MAEVHPYVEDIREQTTPDRFEKGVLLFETQGRQFRRRKWGYYIPTEGSKDADEYAVILMRPESCNCPDYMYRASTQDILCKHQVAAKLKQREFEAHLIVDEPYCRMLADELGCGWVAVEEVFGGEPKSLAQRMLTWVEQEEENYREKHGVRETMRNFKAIRLLKRWARESKRGAYREDNK